MSQAKQPRNQRGFVPGSPSAAGRSTSATLSMWQPSAQIAIRNRPGRSKPSPMIYWIPIYEILEQRDFEVMVVNARGAKHVPGRKWRDYARTFGSAAQLFWIPVAMRHASVETVRQALVGNVREEHIFALTQMPRHPMRARHATRSSA